MAAIGSKAQEPYGNNLVDSHGAGLPASVAGLRDMEGDIMRSQDNGSSDPLKHKPVSEPEIDYSPKNYTFKENLLIIGKMLAIAAFLLFLLWISQRHII